MSKKTSKFHCKSEAQKKAIRKSYAVKAKQDFFAEIKDLPTRSLAHDTYINSAKKFAKHNICAYDTALKKIRPTAPFVIAGAVTGLVSSFVYNVFRTDV